MNRRSFLTGAAALTAGLILPDRELSGYRFEPMAYPHRNTREIRDAVAERNMLVYRAMAKACDKPILL